VIGEEAEPCHLSSSAQLVLVLVLAAKLKLKHFLHCRRTGHGLSHVAIQRCSRFRGWLDEEGRSFVVAETVHLAQASLTGQRFTCRESETSMFNSTTLALALTKRSVIVTILPHSRNLLWSLLLSFLARLPSSTILSRDAVTIPSRQPPILFQSI
jgi:hypothetical protein